MKFYKDKVILITGAKSGLGASIAHLLFGYDATVIAADINYSKSNQLSKENAISKIHLDVTDEHSFFDTINGVVKTFGRIDILFNCAGINYRGETLDLANLNGDLKNYDFTRVRSIIDTNLLGTIIGSSLALAFMKKQGFGQIVNIASLAGSLGYSTSNIYAPSKSGVIRFTEEFRIEASPVVGVTCVCPGYFLSQFLKSETAVDGVLHNMEEELEFDPVSTLSVATAILKAVERNPAFINYPKYPSLFVFYFFQFLKRLILYRKQEKIFNRFRIQKREKLSKTDS